MILVYIMGTWSHKYCSEYGRPYKDQSLIQGMRCFASLKEMVAWIAASDTDWKVDTKIKVSDLCKREIIPTYILYKGCDRR